MADEMLPPGLDRRTLARVPAELREDAIQAAWVARLQGRSANDACQRESRATYRNQHREVASGLLADKTATDSRDERGLLDLLLPT